MNYKYYSKSYKEKDYKELLEYGLDSFIMSLYNPYISSKYWKGKKNQSLGALHQSLAMSYSYDYKFKCVVVGYSGSSLFYSFLRF